MKTKSLYAHTHTHTDMVKVISLSEVAYKELKEKKEKEESFSDVVIKLIHSEKTKKKKTIMDFFGKWPGDKKELDKIQKMISEDRKKAKTREVKF